jgi:asparagine synthase (glutamine-hydrolysing)
MCGIAGILAYRENSDPVSLEELRTVRESMIFRGPDDFGEWISSDGRVALAQRRLAIIDLTPTGAQPMMSGSGRCTIVFNGEIYNYRSLRNELEGLGRRFQSNSDTEVLLHLYEEYGEDMVHRLRGMFAFAIWDNHRRGIFLARDCFGIKPLYFSDNGKTLRFASQVKALLASGQVDISPEPAGHAGFFLWGYVPDPFTLYRGIRSLSAGTCMWIGLEGLKRQYGYRAVKDLGSDESCDPQVVSKDERIPILRETLADSVRHHLIADVPVGIFLSSGLDSSTILALASEQESKLHAVTVGFEEYRRGPYDETMLAADVARQYGAYHHTVWIKRQDFLDHRERILQHMDQPSIDGVNTYFVSLAANRAGLKVALSGLGGDELFGSYPSFRDVPRLAKLLQFLSTGSKLGGIFRKFSSPILKIFTSPKYAGLFEYGGSVPGAYLLRRALFMPWELDALLDSEAAAEGLRDLQTLERLADTISGLENSWTMNSILETCWYMRNQLLRDADWAGMAHSVEIRVPFVDKCVVASIRAMRMRGIHYSKTEMALTPKQPLPRSVLHRKKTGFATPIGEWMLSNLNERNTDRSKRGWARYIAKEMHICRPTSEAIGIPEPGKDDNDICERFASSSKSERGHSVAKTVADEPHRILVYRISQLGDMIVSLPAMWAIRSHFPKAQISLLCEYRPNRREQSWNLVNGTGLINKFESYPAKLSFLDFYLAPFHMLMLLVHLRRQRYDAVIYLAPSLRSEKQTNRDRKYFRAAGITRFIGFNTTYDIEKTNLEKPLPVVPHEADLLLQRLANDGIPVPEPGKGCMEFGLSDAEKNAVTNWLRLMPSDRGRPWIAVGPASRMPAKMWPIERYACVVQRLITQHDIWPVVFGGPEDACIGDRLIREWRRGYNACGRLSLRESVAAIARSTIYLGNDTATMHMASAMGVPCVALFSAREAPGQWYPYHEPQHVFRAAVPCEGCKVTTCSEHQNNCMKKIGIEEVYEICSNFIKSQIFKLSSKQSMQ